MINLREDWNNLVIKNERLAICSKYSSLTEKDFRLTGMHYSFNILRFLPDICNTILDYGCGNGRVMEFMSHFCNKIVGIDVSDEMIKRARKRLVNTQNVILIRDDKPNILERIDFAYCVGVFHHNSFETIKEIIDSIMSVNNGRLYFNYLSTGERVERARGSYPLKERDLKKFLSKYKIVFLNNLYGVIQNGG